jgi:hypothetical protein
MGDAHIILAGQSNVLGFANSGLAPYMATDRVQIWTDTNDDGVGDAWNFMQPGLNTGTPANPGVWGSEVGFAKAWLAANTDGVLWINKLAKGGTALAADPEQLDWSPESRGEMFDNASAALRAAKLSLAGTMWAFDSWDLLAWGQGETDATDPGKAAAYGDNLHDFVQHARDDWGVEDIALMRIGGQPAHSLAVRTAQWAIDQEDPHIASFRTIGLPTRPDAIHYDAAGHLAVGRGFFDAWAML